MTHFVGQVLDQIASIIHIQELKSVANAQDRHRLGQSIHPVRNGLIPDSRVRANYGAPVFFAVLQIVDISSSRNQKSIDLVYSLANSFAVQLYRNL